MQKNTQKYRRQKTWRMVKTWRMLKTWWVVKTWRMLKLGAPGIFGAWQNVGCYLLHATPLPPPTSPLPTPRICRTACGHVIRISWRETPPPPTHTPHSRILANSGSLGQYRGRPPFRSLWVLQLNLDSNCDHVRIFGAVIGHLEAEIDFWIFHEK